MCKEKELEAVALEIISSHLKHGVPMAEAAQEVESYGVYTKEEILGAVKAAVAKLGKFADQSE